MTKEEILEHCGVDIDKLRFDAEYSYSNILMAMGKYADQQTAFKSIVIEELKAEVERLKYHKECNELIRKAFEAGIIVGNGGKRGNTSLWSEYVDKHFMNFIRPYLNIENNKP